MKPSGAPRVVYLARSIVHGKWFVIDRDEIEGASKIGYVIERYVREAKSTRKTRRSK